MDERLAHLRRRAQADPSPENRAALNAAALRSAAPVPIGEGAAILAVRRVDVGRYHWAVTVSGTGGTVEVLVTTRQLLTRWQDVKLKAINAGVFLRLFPHRPMRRWWSAVVREALVRFGAVTVAA